MIHKAKHMAKLMAKSSNTIQRICTFTVHISLSVDFRRTSIAIHGHITRKSFWNVIRVRPDCRLDIRIGRADTGINHIDKVNNTVAIAIIRGKINIPSDKRIHRLANSLDSTRSHIPRIN